jgi:hypothetical protein
MFELNAKYIPGDYIRTDVTDDEEFHFIHRDCDICNRGPKKGKVIMKAQLCLPVVSNSMQRQEDNVALVKFNGDCVLPNVATKTGDKCIAYYLYDKI